MHHKPYSPSHCLHHREVDPIYLLAVLKLGGGGGGGGRQVVSKETDYKLMAAG